MQVDLYNGHKMVVVVVVQYGIFVPQAYAQKCHLASLM